MVLLNQHMSAPSKAKAIKLDNPAQVKSNQQPHAVYGEHVGLFNIETLEMIEGDLPKRAKKLIIEWATLPLY